MGECDAPAAFDGRGGLMLASLGDREVPVADPGGGLVGAVRRRFGGTYAVDPWGLDRDVLAATRWMARRRWSTTVEGEPLPRSGPVLLVANDRVASLAPLAAALALGEEAGRPIRFTGVADVEPLATALHRLGGMLAEPAEVAGALRAGEVVVVWCRDAVRLGPPRVGRVAPELLLPAVELGVPVVPVAIEGRRIGRHLRVEVGPPLSARARPSPLAAAELADAARAAVQALLDDR